MCLFLVLHDGASYIEFNLIKYMDFSFIVSSSTVVAVVVAYTVDGKSGIKTSLWGLLLFLNVSVRI